MCSLFTFLYLSGFKQAITRHKHLLFIENKTQTILSLNLIVSMCIRMERKAKLIRSDTNSVRAVERVSEIMWQGLRCVGEGSLPSVSGSLSPTVH